MSELVLLGINHNTAPIDVRERLAIPAGRLADATRSLAHFPGIREGLILSTCNRVELLTLQDPGPSHLTDFLENYFAVPAATILPHLYEFREREAVRHLFRVAASLDSMVVGEPQILGQVKESYTVAREVGAIGIEGGQTSRGGGSARGGSSARGEGSARGGGSARGEGLDRLLQSAFTVAKKVRTETQIGSSSVSIASVAVDLARKIFGSLAGKQVLLVGAGKMSELAVRHLIQHGATRILICNRTVERAQRVAAQFQSANCTTEVLPFESLYAEAARADIVITSTGAPQQLFGQSHGRHFIQHRRGRPMFFIDIAVPRDVDPRMNTVEGCFVYDIDDLQQVAATHLTNRTREAAAAEQIVADEVTRYQQRLQQLDQVPAIKALQAQAEQLRQTELARSEKALATMTPQQREAVEALTRSLTNKLLHPQLVALRAPARNSEALKTNPEV